MKALTILSIFSVAPVLVLSASCNNNCGRQVAGTGRSDPPLSIRSSLCSEFVTTYVTIARGLSTGAPHSGVKGRNVHAPREETPVPVVTGTKPAYASACSDATAYWSACQCFTGIKATTITIVAGAVTTTSSISSSKTISTPVVMTTATSTSGPALPSCTIGAEFALHIVEEESDLCKNMLQDPYFEPKEYDIKGLLQGRRPAGVGIERYPSYEQQEDDVPINYGGVQGPPGSSLRCNILVHRGYIKATLPGAYEFLVNEPQDVMFVWFGDKAKSGAFNASNPDIVAPNSNGWPYRYFFYFRDASEYIPFRMFWSNGKGPGSFSVGIFPTYTVGLDEDVEPENPIFYSNCSGSNSTAPAWAAWEDENYSEEK